ncbi:MAG: ABC transporter substrate-binding protein [Chloroflexi bacterium]|nr:ABC transporter substrate-binding protein [Chloroflexota bacterium]
MRTQRLVVILAGLTLLFAAACGPAATPTPRPNDVPLTATPLPPQATAQPAATPTLAPAATGPRQGGVLRTAAIEDVRAWESFEYVSNDNYRVLEWVHTRLARMSPEAGCDYYPMQPELATSWRWVDDRTLEIKLRQGAKFQSLPPMKGREFTADDVVFTLGTKWLKAIRQKPLTDAMESIKAVDRYTVQIRLKSPFPMFVDKGLWTDYEIIVGPEIYEGKTKLISWNEHVGLGPFMLKDYTTGVKVVLERNPNYATIRPGLPYLDGIDMLIITDVPTQSAALRSGKLDYMYLEGEPATIGELRRTAPQLKSQSCPSHTPVGLMMRTDLPPFNDVRVRQAISMAIDREAVNKTVYLGTGTLSYSPIGPILGLYHLPLDKAPAELRRIAEYRPEEAKKLLAEAGYPKGFKTEAIYTPPWGAIQRGIAEASVSFLANIGIDASLNVMEYGRFSEVVLNKASYEGMGVGWLGPGYEAETPTWDYYHSKATGRNRSRVNDPKLDKMLETVRVTMDENKRIELYHEIQSYILQQQYYVLFPLPPRSGFWAPYVKGVNFKPYITNQSDFMIYAWMDK